jgi:hypothetical protein
MIVGFDTLGECRHFVLGGWPQSRRDFQPTLRDRGHPQLDKFRYETRATRPHT